MTVERIRAFRHRLQRAAAEAVVPTAHGDGILSPSIRDVYDANYLSVETPVASAAELAAEADRVLEGHFHRRVIVEQGGAGLAGDFDELGYQLATHLVLVHAREPDRLVDTSMVREVEFDDLVDARWAGTLAQPWGDARIARQLDDAKRLIAAAIPTRFFAAFAGEEVAAYCELRSDGGVAQIEDVEAIESFRGRGLGRAIVQHALQEGRREHEVVWLEALADDWPRELYAKLGFDLVDRRDFYTRFPHPLTRLSLRTPDLELRVATVAELRELFHVAEAGIHEPDAMPFEFAWTDHLEESEFVAFHLGKQREHRPDDWELPLVAFHDRRPVGVQSIGAKDFARDATVSTGSWLGRPFQGRGLGTEMRAAVLSLAFDGLGAERARSGAIDGNRQSLGVSRKLGYEVVGAHTVTPRREPVEHTDVELARHRFVSPVPVEIHGLEPVLPLFGVSP